MPQIHRRLVLFAMTFCAACSNALTGPGAGGSVEGSWNVVSVNDSPLPVLLPTQYGCAQTGLSGLLEAGPDGRFTASYQYQVDCRVFREVIDRTITGRYTQNGADLIFAADSGFSKFATAPLVSGVVNGPVLVVQSTPAPGMSVTMTLQRR